jgi:hypothetical protein
MIMISPVCFFISVVFGPVGRRPWNASSRRLHEIQEKGGKGDVPAEGISPFARSSGRTVKEMRCINFLDGEAAGVNWSEAGYPNGAQGRDRTTDTAIFSQPTDRVKPEDTVTFGRSDV